MRKVLKMLFTTMLITLATGCKHHHLYYAINEFVTVTLDIDWSKSGLKPNGVTVFAYNQNGTLYRKFPPFATRSGLELTFPEGLYDIVLYNNTPSEYTAIKFEGEDHRNTLLAKGVPTTPNRKPEGADKDMEFIKHPEVLAAAIVEDVAITPDLIKYCKEQPEDYVHELGETYTAYPIRKVENVRVFVDVENLHWALGGPYSYLKMMSGGHLIGADKNDKWDVTHEFALKYRSFDEGSLTKGTIMSEFTSFGPSADPDMQYWVDIDFVLTDKTHYNFVADVTDQVEIWWDDYIPRIDIYLKVTLPEPSEGDGDGDGDGSGGGGGVSGSFGTDVEDWDDYFVTVPM